MSASETIAAIATAPGRASIGVVRVSGAELGEFARRLCGGPVAPRRPSLVVFRNAAGQPIDQGLAIYFPGPGSFTGEDVLELQGHGGPVVLRELLGRCLELGARLADPGEFSRRAFLNDKLDLAQAEAIADLIDAATAQAARSAVRSLTGEFSRQVDELNRQLIELRLLVEANLDFSDEEIDTLQQADLAERLRRLHEIWSGLNGRAQRGSVLRTGLTVVLAGLPNVGKSSLLNRLAGQDRAIVTDVAGTTRDALRETIQVEGIPLHIIDTAGLRETDDPVERIGVERSWREIGGADVVLQIIDCRTGLTPADRAIAARLPDTVERIVVENKCDLAELAAERFADPAHPRQIHLRLSAKNGAGISLLHDELLRIAGWQNAGEDVILARDRHLAALADAGDHIGRAGGELARLEVAAEELRLAQRALNRITGEFTADDLLGEIFGRFCIGK